jgi:dTDP-4-amino-4,6-dideoxygalactose transaminase
VAAVVRRGWVAPGPEVAAFEQELATVLGTEAAVAVSSGSAGLELAMPIRSRARPPPPTPARSARRAPAR